jgi:ubiquinol-cytochrome c reductase cytochrome b subunit
LIYEAKVALLFGIGLIIIGIVGLFFPVGLGEPANSMVTPDHTTPEWYFLALFQMLKLECISKTIGALIPVVLILVIAIWPFLDRKPDKSRFATRNRMIISAIIVAILIIMTILGEVT